MAWWQDGNLLCTNCRNHPSQFQSCSALVYLRHNLSPDDRGNRRGLQAWESAVALRASVSTYLTYRRYRIGRMSWTPKQSTMPMLPSAAELPCQAPR